MKDDISPEDFQSAIANIARTADGRLLYLWLLKARMFVPDTNDPGALQADRGYRMFAAELMARMFQAMAENIGDGSINQRPIVFAVRAAVDTNAKPTRRGYLASLDSAAGS